MMNSLINKTISKVATLTLTLVMSVLPFSPLSGLHDVPSVHSIFNAPKAEAAFNQQINYQGKLHDSSNNPVADGVYHMKFRLYTALSGGTQIWHEERSSVIGNRVTVTNGLFSVLLGSSTPFTNVDFDQDLYLQVEIGGTASSSWETLSPRKRLGAVPTAILAQDANTVGGVASTSLLRSDADDEFEAGNILTITGTLDSNGDVSFADTDIAFDGASTNFAFTGDLTFNTNQFALDTSTGYVGIGTTSPYARLSVVGEVVASHFTATTTATSTFAGGIATNLLNVTSTSASSTFANGINLTDGCFAVNGTCITGGGGGSGTPGGSDGQIQYNNSGSFGGATGLVYDDTTGNVGVGTTSPYAPLSVLGQVVASYFTATTTATSTFPRASITNLALGSDYLTDITGTGLTITSGVLSVDSGTFFSLSDWFSTSSAPQLNTLSGLVSFGSSSATTTALGNLAVIGALDVNSTSASSTFANGIVIENGCLLFNGSCLTQGSTFAYLFPSNATSTLLTFNGGLASYASTTIGDSSQTGGLTVFGGATTTGNAYIAGNVGIGTPAPGANLTIRDDSVTGNQILFEINTSGTSDFTVDEDGDITFTGTIIAPTGSLGAPTYSFAGDSNTGIYQSATNQIDFVANGNSIFEINQNAVKVGSASGSAKFSASSTDAVTVRIEQQGAFDLLELIDGTTEVLTVADGGNLGLGTTSPYARLSVVGEIVGAYFTGTTTATSTFGGGIQTARALDVNGSATSTFANGIRIEGGCLLYNGTCLTGESAFGQAWQLTTNTFSQTALVPTTTVNIAVTGTGTSTFAGGLEAWRSIAAPYFVATSTASSTLTNLLTTSLFLTGRLYDSGGGSGTSNQILTSTGSGTDWVSSLNEAQGGTGQTTYTTGDILYASGANTLSKLGIGSAGQVLKVSGGGIPSWGADNSGGGGGSGLWATTTDSLVVYPSDTSDVVVIGNSATTSTGYVLEVDGSAYFDRGTFVVDSVNNRVGVGTSSPYAPLSVLGQVVASYFTATTTATSTFAGGIATNLLNVTSTSASSTFANGINLTDGCFAVNGTCITGGGSGSTFAWSVTGYGVSTSTTLGFLNGFLSTASSTIDGPLRLPNLSAGGLAVGAGGLVYSGATTTAGTGITYNNGAFDIDYSTDNSWTGHNIFSSLFATNASSTNATTTSLTVAGLFNLGSDYINDITGTGLTVTSNALTVDQSALTNIDAETLDGADSLDFLSATTSDTAAGEITFGDGYIATRGTTTNATSTDLHISSRLSISDDYITDFNGAGLVVSNGVLTVDDVTAAMLVNGDFGDFSCNGTTCSFDADTINTDEFADADWGDLSVSSGSVTLDTNVVGDNEIDYTEVTLADFDIDDFAGDTNDDDDLDVAAGGTGVSTFTDGGILIGNGTGDIVTTAVLANGELLIGDGTTDPTVATLTETADEITVTNGAGSITLSLPDNVYGGSSFNIGRDADNLFDFATDNEITFRTNATDQAVLTSAGNFGIGTSSPYAKLSVVGEIVGAYFTGTTTATSTFGGGIQTAGALDVNSTTATSTFANGIRFEGGGIRIDKLTNCDTIDTDANGNIICGTDANTPFAWTTQSWGNSTTTTLGFLNGFLSTASSTIVGNATTTGTQGVGALFVNNDYITDFTGDALEVSGGTLNVNDVTAAMLASSDFGDFLCNGTTCSFDADTINTDEFADADWGDLSVSGGSVTLDANTVSDNEIDYTTVTLSDFTNDEGYITSSVRDWQLTTNTFSQSALAPTTTQNIAVTGTGTSTFAGGLEAWRAIAAPYYIGTSTASSTFAGGINITSGCIAVNGTCIEDTTGATTFLGLTDTPGSFNANRIPYTNSGGTALTDSANLVFSGSELDVTGNVDVTGVYKTDNVNLISFGSSGGDLYVGRNAGGSGGLLTDANVAIGNGAGLNLDEGTNNVIVGDEAGDALTSGSSNIFLGYQTGDNTTTGSSNILIGPSLDTPAINTSNYLSIGNVIYGNLSTGYIGIGTSTPYARLSVVGEVVGAYYTATTSSTSTLPQLDVTDIQIANGLEINSDFITDLTGSGLTISGGALTVDGSSLTNVDADTLDGANSSDFLSATTSDTAAGEITFNDGLITNRSTTTQATTTNLSISDRLSISGDHISDFNGDGLVVNSGVLTVDDVTAAMLVNGDFGDFSCNGTTCSFDNDTINTDEFADADWGDLSVSSGSVTLDTNVVGDNEIDYTEVTLADFDIDDFAGDTSDDDDLDVAAGGTGVSTLTDGGVLIGNGTGDIVATAVLGNGELLIGDGTTDPTVATLTGTANELTVTNGAGSITLSLPDNVYGGTSFNIGRDADNLFDFVTDNEITFRTNATDQAVLTSAGNFGLGTTSPYAKLSVVGEVVGAYYTATTTSTSTLPQLDVTDIQIANGLDINGDFITDLTGTGLTVTGGALTVDGSSITGVDADTLDGANSADFLSATTSDAAAGQITFNAGLITTNGTSTNDFYITNRLSLNGDYISDLTGDALEVSGGALNVNDVTAAMLASSDFGDFSCNGTTCSFDADTINTDEFADADWGDLSVSSGSVTLDTNVVGDNEIDYTEVTLADFDIDDFAGDTNDDDDLDVAAGGTGVSTITGLIQGNGTSDFTAITDSSTVGQVLRVTGAATYAWGALDLADSDAITGTLPVGNGGTGATSLDDILGTSKQLTITNGANTIIGGDATLSLANHVAFPSSFEVTQSTTTHATTTNLDITNLLTFNGVTGDEWSDFCTTITGGSGLCDGTDADSGFGWTTTTNYAALANATGTPLWFQAGFQASSTSYLVNATSSQFEITDSIYISGDRITDFNGDGLVVTSNTLTVDDVTAAMLVNGDFGDFSCNGTTCSFDADTINTDEFADADWGDLSVSGGSVTLDANTVSDNEIDYSTVTLSDFTNDAGFITNSLRDWQLTTNTFSQSALAPTTTQNIAITGTGTSTIVGGLEAWRSIASPYFVATSTTATSTLFGGLVVDGGGLEYDYSSNDLSVDTSTLFVDSSANRVGIGTVLPDATLEVAGSPASVLVDSGALASLVLDKGATTDSSLVLFRAGGATQWSIGSSDSDIVGDGDEFYIGRSNPDTAALFIETNDFVGIGTTSPYAKLSVAGHIVGAYFTSTSTATSTFAGAIDVTEANATSTFAHGIDIASGCLAVNGTCLTSGGGSGTVNSGTTGQVAYYNANGTAVTGTSSIFIDTSNSHIGIGTTSPYGTFSVFGSQGVPTIVARAAGNQTSNLFEAFNDSGESIFSVEEDGSLIVSDGTPISDAQLTVRQDSNTDILNLYDVTNLVFTVQDGGRVALGDTITADGQLSVRQDGTTDIFNLYDGATNVFSVIDGGNVGISESTPGEELHISADGAFVRIQADTLNSSTRTGVSFYETASFDSMALMYAPNGNYMTISDITAGEGSPIDVLTVYRDDDGTHPGYVGIGDNDPDARLEIVDNGADVLHVSSNAGNDGDFLTIDTSGNIGISETTPGELVHIKENGARIRIESGTANDTNPLGVTFYENNGTDSMALLYDPSTNKTHISDITATESSAVHLLTVVRDTSGGVSAGNVGIGSTSPYAKLSVAGDIIASHYTGTSTATSTFGGGLQTAGTLDVNSTTATSTFANGLRLEGGGLQLNKLISCDTVDTDANGNFICGSDNAGGGGVAFAWTDAPSIGASAVSTSTLLGLFGGFVSTASSTVGDGTQAGGLTIHGGATTTGNLYVAGRIGIQTETPRELLDVSGTNVGDGAVLGVAKVGVWDNSSNYAMFAHNDIHTDASSYALIQENTGETFLNSAGGQPLHFRIDNVERMTLDTNGNFGIGTTSPYAKLSVAGGSTVLDSNLIRFASSSANLLTLDYAAAATSTIQDGENYAWTIATSTTADPIISIDTSGSVTETTIGAVGTGDVYIGDVGSASNLVFEESASILGQGGNTITFGQSGDIFNFAVNLGIGTSSPYQELSVNGDIALQFNGAATTNGVCHSGATDHDTSTASVLDLVVCSAAPGDIAEWYATESNVEAGDIVAIGESSITYDAQGVDPDTGAVVNLWEQDINVLKKADSSSGIVGIVSTAPFQDFGTDIKSAATHSNLVALVGRVPVKVTTENGSIKAGDKIAISDIAGMGMKATKSGVTVGIALDDFEVADATGTATTSMGQLVDTGTVLVLTNLGYTQISPHVVDGELVEGEFSGIDSIYSEYVSTTTAAMYIDEDGKIGIGTSTPQYDLHVVGDVAAESFVNISTADSKKNIAYLEESQESVIENLRTLRPARYHYKTEEDTNNLRLGLIAEDAPEDILSVDGKGVDIYKLSTFILAGVQDIDERLLSLEDRVATIEDLLALGDLPVSSGGVSLNGVINGLKDFGIAIQEGFTQIANLKTDNLTVGSASQAAGVTLFDEATGEPYCLVINEGNIVSRPGACDLIDQTVATSAEPEGDTEPPVIQLNGNNPAEVPVGGSYSDLGATVTDNMNQNLGYQTFVNGVEDSQVSIDTSEVATFEVEYRATDGAGNTASVIRTINIIDPYAEIEENPADEVEQSPEANQEEEIEEVAEEESIPEIINEEEFEEPVIPQEETTATTTSEIIEE